MILCIKHLADVWLMLARPFSHTSSLWGVDFSAVCTLHAAAVHGRRWSTTSPSSVFLDQLLGWQTPKASEASFENSCELRKYGTSAHKEQQGSGHRRSAASQAAKSSLIRAGNPERVTRCPRHHHNTGLINSDGTWRRSFTLSFYSTPVFMREMISVSKPWHFP